MSEDPTAPVLTQHSKQPQNAAQWALSYIGSSSLVCKLAPPPLQFDSWTSLAEQPAPVAPGRPPELKVCLRGPKRPKQLQTARARAQLIHTFLHHELQAAELMCWALLQFPESELAFRQGLIGICRDEIRHMRLYQQHLDTLGYKIGDFPVRDWFWERIPSCTSKESFVSVMGLGLEAANLEHAERFAQLFEEVGDVQGAELQRRVGAEEVGHVRFGCYWLERWTGRTLDFRDWMARLPAPLSPLLMHQKPLNVVARRQGGQNAAFLTELEKWSPE